MTSQQKNRRLALTLALVVAVMIGLSFAAVPLYSIFCKATGFGGTTQRAEFTPSAASGNRILTVTFNADIAPELPWDFAPEVQHISLRIGEPATIKYHARNNSTRTIVGTAVHNVQPDKIGIYFDKTQCFCFTEQVLKPGQEADFPVTFFIDPDMAQDHKLDDVQNVTLSYTFYLAKDQAKATLAHNDAANAPKSN